MKLIGDILAELFGMFLGDARLSAADCDLENVIANCWTSCIISYIHQIS